MEPIAKKWYDHLEQGKIMGARCLDCGAFTFPPLTVCRQCNSRNIEWQEISGKGTVIMVSSTILPAKQFAKYAPIPYGIVKLEEGPCFFTKVEGVNVSSPEAIEEENKKMPLEAKAEIQKLEGVNIVVFRKV
ncbi:MAG: Zn-ribbon domain-containing OB-fold protein [Candidatus Paceibacterota bacterium]